MILLILRNNHEKPKIKDISKPIKAVNKINSISHNGRL